MSITDCWCPYDLFWAPNFPSVLMCSPCRTCRGCSPAFGLQAALAAGQKLSPSPALLGQTARNDPQICLALSEFSALDGFISELKAERENRSHLSPTYALSLHTLFVWQEVSQWLNSFSTAY